MIVVADGVGHGFAVNENYIAAIENKLDGGIQTGAFAKFVADSGGELINVEIFLFFGHGFS